MELQCQIALKNSIGRLQRHGGHVGRKIRYKYNIAANDILLLAFLQHGCSDVKCKPRIDKTFQRFERRPFVANGGRRAIACLSSPIISPSLVVSNFTVPLCDLVFINSHFFYFLSTTSWFHSIIVCPFWKNTLV